MIIKAEGKFWQRTNDGWMEIPATEVSETAWTRQPSRQRQAEMRAELRAASSADFAAAEAAGKPFDPMSFDEMPTPRTDAMIAALGEEYQAMVAYEYFYECSQECAGQVYGEE